MKVLMMILLAGTLEAATVRESATPTSSPTPTRTASPNRARLRWTPTPSPRPTRIPTAKPTLRPTPPVRPTATVLPTPWIYDRSQLDAKRTPKVTPEGFWATPGIRATLTAVHQLEATR